jgi:hypothetical protein
LVPRNNALGIKQISRTIDLLTSMSTFSKKGHLEGSQCVAITSSFGISGQLQRFIGWLFSPIASQFLKVSE